MYRAISQVWRLVDGSRLYNSQDDVENQAPFPNVCIRLQYLDARHSTLLDLQDGERNPFLQCQRSLTENLVSPLLQGPLQTLFRHWGTEGADGEWLLWRVFTTLISMLCQIHWRFILYFLVWPFPLAGYVDPRRSREQQNRVASRYWHDCTHSPCCVDRFFGLKLFLLMGSLAAFVLDDDIRAALLLWARKTKLANMSLERLLALFKASCDEDHPMVERLAAASYLTQWLVNHHAAGGVDPRKTQARSELLRRGAPLAAANSKLAKRKARRGKNRSYCSGAQTFVWKHGLKIKLSRRARFAERSRLLNVFGTMSAEEKLRYQREELEAWEASIPHVADPDDKYQHVIGDKLFGLSSREFALREDVCVNGIREVTPEPTKQGMRNYEPKLREWSRQRLVVSDEGKAIPKTLRVTDTLPCGLAHPGLCPVKTAAYFEKGISVTQAMIKTVTDNMKVGDMFKLVATPDIGFFFGVVGYIRLRDPATVCALKMVMSDDGRFEYRIQGGHRFCLGGQ